MRKVLVGLAFVLIAAAGAIYAVFFRASPSEQCRVIARWSAAASDSVRLYHPMGLAWAGGVLYVANAERGTIERYRGDGTPLAAWGGFTRPVAVAATGHAIYVADYVTDQVTTLTSDGVVVRRWGRHGTGPGEFDGPSGVAVDQRGDVYVTDFFNHRVQRFSGDGRFLLEWGHRGRWRGRLRYPTGVAASPRGEILVADGFNNRVQRFTADGGYLAQWGGIGFGVGGARPGWFRLAKDVAADSAGKVFVADAFNGRLQTFTADGELLALWGGRRRGDAPLRYASGVAVDPGGPVYVGDFFRNEVRKLDCR